ncbi:MAG: DUF72 domain-containing protein [Chloroflexi bacterium]|nr:DUF72 domain-containing protein [Chloroflexota bacterium]
MIRVGTSGYNYPEWRGSFYPPGFPTSKMLAYYADRFSTVEINYTFYHMPTEKVLEGWAKQTPEEFAFTLKAPRSITHESRLQHCETLAEMFVTRAAVLGPKLGVLLFQLPPSFRKNLSVLAAFIDLLPPGTRAAFEFRHRSWHADDVYGVLRAHNLALCIMDSEDMSTPVVATADYGYFRLRDEGYQPTDIQRWGVAVLEHGTEWQDVFVYFKHESAGRGAEFGRIFLDCIAGKDGG